VVHRQTKGHSWFLNLLRSNGCQPIHSCVLVTLAMPPFYMTFVKLPDANSPPPDYIQSSPKFSPFFDAALGTIDGTQFNCSLSAEERSASRNCKGILTQNYLAVCSFDLHFTYMLSGWEGSTADSTLFHDVCEVDLFVPPGRYYLADTSFASCNALLVPYQNVQYHLHEGKYGNSQCVIPFWQIF
jgi:DDE superfamily endonuclease